MFLLLKSTSEAAAWLILKGLLILDILSAKGPEAPIVLSIALDKGFSASIARPISDKLGPLGISVSSTIPL